MSKLQNRKHCIFRSHVSAVYSSCFYHIRDLWRIHPHLDLDSAKLLSIAPVSSHPDYCNSLLYDITDTDLTKLQCVHNRLARSVTKSPPFTFLSLLRSLHWLPVKFKYRSRSVCCLTKCFMKSSLFIFTPCLITSILLIAEVKQRN